MKTIEDVFLPAYALVIYQIQYIASDVKFRHPFIPPPVDGPGKTKHTHDKVKPLRWNTHISNYKA